MGEGREGVPMGEGGRLVPIMEDFKLTLCIALQCYTKTIKIQGLVV